MHLPRGTSLLSPRKASGQTPSMPLHPTEGSPPVILLTEAFSNCSGSFDTEAVGDAAADCCNNAICCAAFSLQDTSSGTFTTGIWRLDLSCSPDDNVSVAVPCCTLTFPSITATRDPSSSALTRKTVPTTDTVMSFVRT